MKKMSTSKEDIYQLIEQLQENDQKTAYDFLYYLIERSKKPAFWEIIDKSDPDEEPLSSILPQVT
ncbi:MAG: hypothetical protein C4554_07415 [Dethiobacter sp.]|jgi:hypothetical protein|nr:MAG: hypothetical protein C4554_07415 [Dethiobacter sp.]